MPIYIDHVYTDRARVHKRVYGARVNFETKQHEEISEWFKCRIALAEANELRSFQHRGIDATHLFIASLTDFAGNPVKITEADKLEVETGPAPYISDSIDAGFFEVMAIANQPRNLTDRALLWYVPLRRYKEY